MNSGQIRAPGGADAASKQAQGVGVILRADARRIPLADRSVQMCVTSPPYWGLRDYQVAGQIGLEAGPEEYVATMVAVMHEVRRVLRDDGTLWLNLGDLYNGAGHGPDQQAGVKGWDGKGRPTKVEGLKPKDLLGMPWRVAFALQANDWYLRSDIIWAKPNPMPESVTDRPTRSHEYLFLLSKSERYFYDHAAIFEPLAEASVARIQQANFDAQRGGPKDYGPLSNRSARQALVNLKARTIPPQIEENPERYAHLVPASYHGSLFAKGKTAATKPTVGQGPRYDHTGRNKRDVWFINSEPFSDWQKTSRRLRVAADERADGKTRIMSPDCPLHGDRSVEVASVVYDAHAADSVSHSERNDDDLAQEQLDGYAATGQLPSPDCAPDMPDLQDQSSAQLAIGRNTRSRKTDLALETNPPYSVSVETVTNTDDRSGLLFSADSAGHKPANNSVAGDSADVPSVQIRDRSEGICSCEYYITIAENTSHFATYPQALIEPCILAGSRPGDLVLDPFLGSGTTGEVCERLGRRWIGLELSESYCRLASRRTAQMGLGL